MSETEKYRLNVRIDMKYKDLLQDDAKDKGSTIGERLEAILAVHFADGSKSKTKTLTKKGFEF